MPSRSRSTVRQRTPQPLLVRLRHTQARKRQTIRTTAPAPPPSTFGEGSGWFRSLQRQGPRCGEGAYEKWSYAEPLPHHDANNEGSHCEQHREDINQGAREPCGLHFEAIAEIP